MTALRPVSSDPAAALDLVRRALTKGREYDAEVGPFLATVERQLVAGEAVGALYVDGKRPVGVAMWDVGSEIGATLQVLFLEPAQQSSAEYDAFLGAIRDRLGPIAFSPGALAGLSTEEEAGVMERRGFAPFSRSEMRLDLRAPVWKGRGNAAGRVRTLSGSDLPALARLHEAAYRDRFDRYLFLVYSDPGRDAELATREILTGRWGDFLPWASFGIDDAAEVSAATLVVRAPYGPLVADVVVDPQKWGRGLGRTVLEATITALRERNETVAVLNVTEGNERALRLYRQLGFVRSLGPSRGWYSPERIPVPPGSPGTGPGAGIGSSTECGR
jgi:ribosomal protein S18 acetylase RimI-like enzyme